METIALSYVCKTYIINYSVLFVSPYSICFGSPASLNYPCTLLTTLRRITHSTRYNICCLLPSESRGRYLWILRSSASITVPVLLHPVTRSCGLLNSIIGHKYSSLAQPLAAIDLHTAARRQDAARTGLPSDQDRNLRFCFPLVVSMKERWRKKITKFRTLLSLNTNFKYRRTWW
jgi:hypothetical protein